MTRLAACYFCGTALDAPLDDHPVVPDHLRGDDGDPATVTLCPSCHEKLEAVLGEVLDAVDGADATSESGDALADEDPDDVLVDPDPAVAEEDPVVSEPDESDPEPDPASDAGHADAPAADADAGAESPAGPDETTRDEGRAQHGDGTTDDEGATDDDGATDDEPAQDDDSGERSVVEGKHDISALEYNKVMRLLQNREFPVDREEIEIVAANAYQVARADCEQVIDVAIDRGLIEEADGQLQKPDNA